MMIFDYFEVKEHQHNHNTHPATQILFVSGSMEALFANGTADSKSLSDFGKRLLFKNRYISLSQRLPCKSFDL